MTTDFKHVIAGIGLIMLSYGIGKIVGTFKTAKTIFQVSRRSIWSELTK